MNSQNLGNWLVQLNGKTVDKIYQVDFNQGRHEDIYLPWLFFITFSDFDRFLEIEGDFDGDHIRLNLYDNSELGNKIKENHLIDEPDLWHVYETESDETLGLLLGQKIEFIEYGINKDEYEINGRLRKSQKDVFDFIRFNCGKLIITIFEGSATGLGVSDDPNIQLNFEETFDTYDTRHLSIYLLQAIEEYGASIMQKDVTATISHLYPELFNYIPRTTIEEPLKKAYLDTSVHIEISDYKLKSIEHTYSIQDVDYLVITTSFLQKIKYLIPKGKKGGSSYVQFHCELLKEKYGANNVTIHSADNTISAKSVSTQLAIGVGNSWKFLDIKPNLIELYRNFLPKEIIHLLQTLFLQEEMQEEAFMEESTGIESNILNKITDIDQNQNLQALYLLGWEVFLNGDERCVNFIKTQVTTKETFEYAYYGLELILENNKLVKAYEYTNGDKTERELYEEEAGVFLEHYPENRIFQLVEDADGLHQLGGKLPGDFQLPACKCVVPFQYLGFINNTDPNFDWLPFGIHLTCPIYLNIEKVFLDYSEPERPLIINQEEIENTDTSYDDLNQDSEIIFNEMRFSFVERVIFSETGNAGIPNWIQYPDIPKCPKTGQKMRFLCQLHGGVEASYTNIVPKNEDWRHYYEELNFWGDGDLFIFFEPTSKVACYFIQNM